ncbi:MAG: hypothetical protein KA004_04665 [Verrucomicrobiales bacterium]|nr:hypothetical protein [Verrucomicrobiales bacterium]
MKLYIDLETLELIEGPGFRNPVGSIRFKRGDAAKLEVSFLSGGMAPASIGSPSALEIHFGVKPRGRYDIGYLVHSSVWTMPADGAPSPVYECCPSFNTVELDSALNVGSSTGSELSEITLMGEITWRVGAGQPTSTRTFAVVVENDVNRGTEGVPVSATPAYPAPDGIELVARKGVSNGYAALDGSGKVPAGQLNVTAASIADSTAIGRNVMTASTAAGARTAIGAAGLPGAPLGKLHAIDDTLAWVSISPGRRVMLPSPFYYSANPLPLHFKGLSLYVITEGYIAAGYSLADLLVVMESHHGSTFWSQVLATGASDWFLPGFAVLNSSPSARLAIGVQSSWPGMTSQPGRRHPGSEVFLDPLGMAMLRFPSMGVVSVHGDLTASGSGYGYGYGSY